MHKFWICRFLQLILEDEGFFVNLLWFFECFISTVIFNDYQISSCTSNNLNAIFLSRKAFEQAKKVPGCVFGLREDIEIEKVKQSKYLRALLQQSNGVAVNELVSFTAFGIVLKSVLFFRLCFLMLIEVHTY